MRHTAATDLDGVTPPSAAAHASHGKNACLSRARRLSLLGGQRTVLAAAPPQGGRRLPLLGGQRTVLAEAPPQGGRRLPLLGGQRTVLAEAPPRGGRRLPGRCRLRKRQRSFTVIKRKIAAKKAALSAFSLLYLQLFSIFQVAEYTFSLSMDFRYSILCLVESKAYTL